MSQTSTHVRPRRYTAALPAHRMGCGVDIVELKRFKRSIKKWGDTLLKRVFTRDELAYANRRRDPSAHLAARFAAKEAVVKAVSQVAPAHPLMLSQIEIQNDALGRPRAELSRTWKGKSPVISISLSHDTNVVVASAVAYKA